MCEKKMSFVVVLQQHNVIQTIFAGHVQRKAISIFLNAASRSVICNT
jgi:hypothetical protein